MSQTRLGSLIEALFNILIGYGINFTANMLILPRFGFDITLKQNLLIGLIFTVISVARSYLVRRYFNERLQRMAKSFGRESSVIEFGTQCRLNTAHLPERNLWRNYHGKVVTVTEPRQGNADTRFTGYYYVSFEDETFGHCFVDELEPI